MKSYLSKPRVTSYLIFIIGISAYYFVSQFFPHTTSQLFPTVKNIANTISPTIVETKLDSLKTIATVIKVVDGDTIEIENNQKVRYIGIDTPETKHPIKEVQCYGTEAAKINKSLVEGKKIILKKDVSNVDRYGRLLRYVWLFDNKNATREGLFVNEYLVRNGYAYAATFPPDINYSKLFQEAQNDAQTNMKGLWKSCSVNN